MEKCQHFKSYLFLDVITLENGCYKDNEGIFFFIYILIYHNQSSIKYLQWKTTIIKIKKYKKLFFLDVTNPPSPFCCIWWYPLFWWGGGGNGEVTIKTWWGWFSFCDWLLIQKLSFSLMKKAFDLQIKDGEVRRQ